MPPVCAILFASICVAPPYAAATKTWSMINTPNRFVAEEARRKGIEIEIESSDNLTVVAAASMNRLCRKDSCAYYRRHCDPDFRTCFFSYAMEPAATGEIWLSNSLEIKARSSTIMRKALKHLWVTQESQDRPPADFIPLAKLDQNSPSTEALFCSGRIRIQGCKKPTHPVL